MEPGISALALMTCSGAPLPAGKMPGSRPGRDGGQGQHKPPALLPSLLAMHIGD